MKWEELDGIRPALALLSARTRTWAANQAYMAAHPEYSTQYGRKYYADNKDRVALSNRQWREKNPGYRYMREYGMSFEQYRGLLDNQGGACAICGKVPDPNAPPRAKNLRVDHDHNTGAIRGLLCDNCNLGIGYLADSAEVLRSAAAYLTSPPNG